MNLQRPNATSFALGAPQGPGQGKAGLGQVDGIANRLGHLVKSRQFNHISQRIFPFKSGAGVRLSLCNYLVLRSDGSFFLLDTLATNLGIAVGNVMDAFFKILAPSAVGLGIFWIVAFPSLTSCM